MLLADLVVRNCRAVVTCAGDPRAPADERLAVVPGAALAAHEGLIVWLGPEAELARHVLPLPSFEDLDARGGLLAPGYVDAHTHLVFAGDRAAEFGERCRGTSYQAILARGGGILATVRATRAASVEELVELALPRVTRLLAEGVTTAEAKSGYGLTVDHELEMLRAIRELDGRQPVDLVPTVLPLHALPPEAADPPLGPGRDRWIGDLVDGLLPRVAQAHLARFADAFVEGGAFTPDEARRLARAARELGLGLRLHVDQLSAGGGAELAAELGASTADHLEEVSPGGIAALARAGVTATLLPISTLYLRCPRYAPGRALADAGVPLALGTNVNPGSAMTERFSLALSLACLGNGLSPAEAFFAATRGGALALGLADRGSLAPGQLADLVVHGAASVDHLAYHLGVTHVRAVVKSGRLVHVAPELAPLCS